MTKVNDCHHYTMAPKPESILKTWIFLAVCTKKLVMKWHWATILRASAWEKLNGSPLALVEMELRDQRTNNGRSVVSPSQCSWVVSLNKTLSVWDWAGGQLAARIFHGQYLKSALQIQDIHSAQFDIHFLSIINLSVNWLLFSFQYVVNKILIYY